MIFVDWYHLNWDFIQVLLAFILLAAIIFVRLLRRALRWRPVKISHVEQSLVQFKDTNLIIYRNIIPSGDHSKTEGSYIENSKDNKSNPILLVPPLTVKETEGYHMASALAITGKDVILLTPDQIRMVYTKNIQFSDLLTQFSINHIILFDFSIPLLVNQVRSHLEHNKGFKISLIRPIGGLSGVKPWRKIIPLSPQFLFNLFYRKYLSKIPNLPSTEDVFNDIIWLQDHTDTKVIMPVQTLSIEDSTYEKIFNNMTSSTVVSHGGWSFHRQETVVFGIILAQIYTDLSK